MFVFEEALKLCTEKLGPDHRETLRTRANLGANYRDAGRLTEGLRLLEGALAAARQRPGPLPAILAWIGPELAATYQQAGQFEKAESLLSESLAQA